MARERGIKVKVALYTIFRCTNYGAVLQAMALAETLRDICGEVEVINHRMDPRDNHLLGKITNPLTPWFQRWRNRRKAARRYFMHELFELRRAKTVRLIEEAIRPSAKLFANPSEFESLHPFETVVVGSDQIWNPELNHDFGENQYLCRHFPENQRRVAYAASFGVGELPDGCRREYALALSKFDAITCREETGAGICLDILGFKPEIVLDPTILRSAEWWEARAPGKEDRGAIAAYWVRTPTGEDVDALAAFSVKLGAQVRFMSAGPLPKMDFPHGIVPVIDADPLDFAAELLFSEAVVTDSFHGLQFATLFGKPFAALCNPGYPGSNSSRLVDFAARYGLSSGIGDIEAFRRGEEPGLADFSRFDRARFESDRVRSRAALERMVLK